MLYAFKGGVDGVGPIGQLARDDSGNLYGTTTGTLDQYGFGTVFRLDTSAKEKVLHVFCIDDGYCLHGIQPTAGLLLQQNVFYGTTAFGGPVGDLASYSSCRRNRRRDAGGANMREEKKGWMTYLIGAACAVILFALRLAAVTGTGRRRISVKRRPHRSVSMPGFHPP